jgi:hypothetical protein
LVCVGELCHEPVFRPAQPLYRLRTRRRPRHPGAHSLSPPPSPTFPPTGSFCSWWTRPDLETSGPLIETSQLNDGCRRVVSASEAHRRRGLPSAEVAGGSENRQSLHHGAGYKHELRPKERSGVQILGVTLHDKRVLRREFYTSKRSCRTSLVFARVAQKRDAVPLTTATPAPVGRERFCGCLGTAAKHPVAARRNAGRAHDCRLHYEGTDDRCDSSCNSVRTRSSYWAVRW